MTKLNGSRNLAYTAIERTGGIEHRRYQERWGSEEAALQEAALLRRALLDHTDAISLHRHTGGVGQPDVLAPPHARCARVPNQGLHLSPIEFHCSTHYLYIMNPDATGVKTFCVDDADPR